MNSPFIKARRPFVTLARHRRSDEVLKLKSMIARDRSRFGGRFTSELEWGGSHVNRQWFDFYFVGPDRFSIWNAQISTAHREFWCEVEDLAFCRTAQLLSSDELTRIFAYRSEPSRRSATGKIETYVWIGNEELRFEKLGQKTFREYAAIMADDIALHSPPAIHESFAIDSSYHYGVGLSIVVDRENISKEVIEEAIDRFIALGCKAWQAESPVAPTGLLHKLPY